MALAPPDFSPHQYSHVLPPEPTVLLTTIYSHSLTRYIVTRVAGRHVVFRAATDGTRSVRDSEKVLFTLPVCSALYHSAGITWPLLNPAAYIQFLALETVALLAAACNDGFISHGKSSVDAMARLPVETQALMVWCAYVGTELVAKSERTVDLEPWCERIRTLWDEHPANVEKEPADTEVVRPRAKRARVEASV